MLITCKRQPFPVREKMAGLPASAVTDSECELFRPLFRHCETRLPILLESTSQFVTEELKHCAPAVFPCDLMLPDVEVQDQSLRITRRVSSKRYRFVGGNCYVEV